MTHWWVVWVITVSHTLSMPHPGFSTSGGYWESNDFVTLREQSLQVQQCNTEKEAKDFIAAQPEPLRKRMVVVPPMEEE